MSIEDIDDISSSIPFEIWTHMVEFLGQDCSSLHSLAQVNSTLKIVSYLTLNNFLRFQSEEAISLILVTRNKAADSFREKRYQDACLHYSHLLQFSPQDGIIFSNRSLSHLKLNNVEAALEDAKQTVKFSPGWYKGLSLSQTFLSNAHLFPGYARIGGVYEAMNQPELAYSFYLKARELAGDNVSRNELSSFIVRVETKIKTKRYSNPLILISVQNGNFSFSPCPNTCIHPRIPPLRQLYCIRV